MGNQSHIIDVAKLNDAKSIRDKVFSKFRIMSDRDQYALYILDPDGREEHAHRLDDAELLQICKSPNNELKAYLTLRTIYTPTELQRMKQLRILEKISHQFGEDVDSPLLSSTLQRHYPNTGGKTSGTLPLHRSPIGGNGGIVTSPNTLKAQRTLHKMFFRDPTLSSSPPAPPYSPPLTYPTATPSVPLLRVPPRKGSIANLVGYASDP
ncbi:hypothetical protein HK104_007651, partial [Borealophlyctis nickersoniae]